TLEGRQLIKRGRHVGDLRGSEFGLTPAGHAMVAEIAPHSEEIYAEIERLVGSEEVAQLYQLLELVVQRLGVPSEEELGAD
ncbi:MAG: MarR family winged helix-turn-helix transcriptional regulator, partial [Comamonas sp.]